MVKLIDEPVTGACELRRQLEASAYASLRSLSCHIDRDRVVLTGTVPCFYLRQIAESLAARSVGVDHLESHIEVQF